MIGWLPAPDRLLLQKAGVHVWAVELDDVIFDATRGVIPLSSAERTRAAKFKFERDRRRYLIAHTALREILAGYGDFAASDLQFETGENGKPALAGEFRGSGIGFNLSHSHERALIAVAQGREVGVDIEFVKPDFAFNEVAARFFTANEIAVLHALPEKLRSRAFYKCWTSKEAFLKAKGTGLSGQLDEVEVSLAGAEHVRIKANVSGWFLADLNPGGGYEGALVAEGEPVPVTYYRWRRRTVP